MGNYTDETHRRGIFNFVRGSDNHLYDVYYFPNQGGWLWQDQGLPAPSFGPGGLPPGDQPDPMQSPGSIQPGNLAPMNGPVHGSFVDLAGRNLDTSGTVLVHVPPPTLDDNDQTWDMAPVGVPFVSNPLAVDLIQRPEQKPRDPWALPDPLTREG